MELILLGLVPFLFLLIAASILVVSQLAGFMQFLRFSRRERFNNDTIVGYMRDISLAQTQLGRRKRELEEIARRLKLSNEELGRMNSMKSKFLSMAVHDVRTPLTSVRGFSEMLQRRGALGEQEKKYLSYIIKATDQIHHLMGDLTDLAVIEAGKFRIERVVMDLADFVGEATPSIGLLSSRKGIAFSANDVAPGTSLLADRFRLGRVLANLLGNAVKFTQPGGRIELRTRLMGTAVQFSIKDTGPGIHPSERKLIFQKFYQSQFMRDPKSKAAGWGLGLAISEEIVRAHGGQIGVDSPGLGKGATFWVKVPLNASLAKLRVAAVLAMISLGGLILASPARAQTLPLEEKAKFESALERKAEGVLLRVLGPNRYKVVVEAAVDFTRIEKFDTKEGSVTVRSVRPMPYAWNAEPQAAATELLPGVPMQDQGGASQAPPKPQSYERKNSYATDFLKRLSVTVVLDRTVTKEQTEQVRVIVGDILGISAERGDGLTVIPAPFLPLWKTIWYEPEMAGLAVKYLLITALTIMTLLVVALCLLRLAAVMREMAAVQTHQMSMDLKEPGAENGLLTDEGTGEGSEEEGEKAGELEDKSETVIFKVEPDQIEALAEMVLGEAPANIALLVTHLEPEIRAKLMSALPPDTAEEVLASFGRIRYVEPEVVDNLKEEVERRLAGAVGGLGRLVAMIEGGTFDERQRMIETLSAKDPELGLQLRRRIFLFESLANLNADEWSMLKAKVSNEDWAASLCQGPQEVVEALKKHSSVGSWEILSQMLSAPFFGVEQRRQAQERIGQAVKKLMEDGRISGLAERTVKRLESSASGA